MVRIINHPFITLILNQILTSIFRVVALFPERALILFLKWICLINWYQINVFWPWCPDKFAFLQPVLVTKYPHSERFDRCTKALSKLRWFLNGIVSTHTCIVMFLTSGDSWFNSRILKHSVNSTHQMQVKCPVLDVFLMEILGTLSH